jgi:hypothetical protein
MSDFAAYYCSDEDIAIKALGDYATLMSRAMRLAYGADGVFVSGNRWLLKSASNDFAAQGVPEGAVCTISINGKRENEVIYAAASASAEGLTLRHLGLPAGVGLPPAPIAGATNVAFDVKTCLPSIAEQTRILNQLYRVPALNSLQVASDFKRACVLLVLIDLFGTQTREGENGDDNWGRKMRSASDELTALYTTLDRTYGLPAQARRPSTPMRMIDPIGYREPRF